MNKTTIEVGKTLVIEGLQGDPGVSVSAIEIDAASSLVISLDDGTTVTPGKVVGSVGPRAPKALRVI